MKPIVAQGSFHDVGREVGKASRDEIRHTIRLNVPDLLEAFGGDELRMLRVARVYLEKGNEVFPEASEYLKGLAEGAGLSFNELLPVAFGEELDLEAATEAKRDKCSTLVTRDREGGGWIIGHQEDFWPNYYGKMLVYDLRFDGFPRHVSLNYPGYVPGLAGSLNAAGVAITNNSLWVDAVPGGMPKQIVHFRATLSSSFVEALYWLTQGPFVLTDHFTLVGGEEDLAAGIEVSSHSSTESTCEVVQIHEDSLSDEGVVPAPYTHTNSIKLLEPWVSGRVKDPAHPGTFMRLRKLDEIARTDPPYTVEAMLALLKRQDGVLNRNERNNLTGQPRSVTLSTTVIRASTRDIWFVRYGGEDDGEVLRLTLD